MTEKEKLAIAFGAGFVAGIGGCMVYRHWKASRAGNMVSSRPIPKELLIRACEGGVYLGGTPPDKCSKGKQCPAYCGKPADQDGNILVLGGPGSGKTTGLVYPTIKTWMQGSLIALDCKGGMEDLWHDVHPLDSKKLYVFAPYRKGGGPCSYDFFALLRLDPSHILEHAQDLSEGLIPIEPSDKETVWKKSAQNLCTAAILHYFNEGKSFAETIQEINCHSLTDLIDLLCVSKSKYAQAFVNKFKDASGKTKASIGIELNELPRLLLNQETMEALTPSPDRPVIDWNLFNISGEPFDVIIEVPGNKLKQHSPLIRLLITQLVKTLSLRKEKTYSACDLPSTLVMLDEFPKLGNIPVVIDALATLRSKGAAVLICAQSLAYLDAIYGKDVARTILGNCSYKVIFNEADASSQAYLSALIGGADAASGSVSFNSMPGVAIGAQRRPLIYPEELAHLKNPIVISPYGVCEVVKGHLYVPHTERLLQSEPVSEQGATVTGSQQEEPPCQEDSPDEEDGGADGSEDAAREAVMDSICAYCKTPRSAKEIMDRFNFRGRSQFQAVYLKPLLEQGRLRRTYPDQPKHPEQKYYTVKTRTELSSLSDNTWAHLSIKNDKPEGEGKNDVN